MHIDIQIIILLLIIIAKICITQKYKNVATFCPPHPFNDKELWGSIKGYQYGFYQNAFFKQGKLNNYKNRYNLSLLLLKNGWKIINNFSYKKILVKKGQDTMNNQVYVLVILDHDREIEDCKVFFEQDLASNAILDWADEVGISLEEEETEAEIFMEEDDNGDKYIYHIISPSGEEAKIIPKDVEEY